MRFGKWTEQKHARATIVPVSSATPMVSQLGHSSFMVEMRGVSEGTVNPYPNREIDQRALPRQCAVSDYWHATLFNKDVCTENVATSFSNARPGL
jgi:hypothetical protein